MQAGGNLLGGGATMVLKGGATPPAPRIFFKINRTEGVTKPEHQGYEGAVRKEIRETALI